MKYALIALAVSGCAVTITPLAPYTANYGLPPERFDHPYDGPVIIHGVDPFDVQDACHSMYRTLEPDTNWQFVTMRSDQIMLGCALLTINAGTYECHITMPDREQRPDDGFEYDLETILRHEMGHCNGWSPLH